jgi:MOSC domain-containing protein YiiM
MTRRGELVAIYVASAAKAPMRAIPQVRAIAGRGLEGDRYHDGSGTYFKPQPDCQVTLIEVEALEALEIDYQLALPPEQTRRNLLTRGVALNHLADKFFRIGEVELHGHRLCEPCKHLEQLAGLPVRAGLVHRGGLRAEIVKGGVIREGDAIGPV